ncbi:MAG: amidase [Rhodobacteraceae bacterium]|nr:amidase [Paracoccaceae bacterium]
MSVESLLWERDALGCAEAVRTGEVSAPELVEAAIARAERLNPRINAIAEPLFDRARKMARQVAPDAPLAGVPFAIKDLAIAWEGVPCHSGSRVPPARRSPDSVLTARYLAAGLVPIATSTTPEHGLRLMTESAAFGITRNPWNTGHTSGGSSGGASALVAAGIVPVAHASDGGGSIRVPAAATGLVGLKPSRGRIPKTPHLTEGWHGLIVDHVVCRSVRDCATLLDLTHGPDLLAPYAAPGPAGTFAAAAARAPGRLRIGVYRGSPLGLPVSDDTHDAMEAAIALAREGGHAVEEIALPAADRAFLANFSRIVASATAATMRAEARRLGRDPRPMLERTTRVVARLGELLSAGESHDALQQLHAASREIITGTAHLDAVLMPVLAHPPLPVGAMRPRGMDAVLEAALDRLRLTRALRLPGVLDTMLDKSLWFTHWTAVQNVTGQPAIALPVHVTAAGLPLGVQAVGRPGDEETLLSLAAQMEAQSGWLARRAPRGRPGGA